MMFKPQQGLLILLLCLFGVTAAHACAGTAETERNLPPAPVPTVSGTGVSEAEAPVGRASEPGGGMVLRHGQPLEIPRLDAAPKLEDFLSARLGSKTARQMLRVSNFIERSPTDGNVPREPTVAYLGYTHEYFFAAFVCADDQPSMIRAHMLARDSLGDDDSVELMLDTFHDQRRAFEFQSNPLGIQADALYSEREGHDYSFDTVWDTWGRRTKHGYVVLFRIPFASLYFAQADPGEARTWGIILGRSVPHTNESDYWPRISHDIAGRLTQDMEVEGFRDIEHGRNVQLQPYSLARNFRQLNAVDKTDPYMQDKHLQGFTGLDAKAIVHNSLVLDATVNPDFSQVGVDNPAEPNQRFPPYYAEVRPFFIENSSYFQTPISLYYTNNIQAPQFGARLTGKLGPWAMGLLGVDDRGPGQGLRASNPAANTRAHFYMARVDRDLGKRSDAGLIFADREYRNSFNRAGGVDYRTRLKERWTLSGQALTSQTLNLSNDTPGERYCENYHLSCSGQAYYNGVSYSDLHTSWWAEYDDTSAGFVTDTGFFRRPDVRQPSTGFSYTFRPESGPLLTHGPSVYAERIWDHNGVPLDFYVHPKYSFDFKGRTSLSVGFSVGEDRLRPIDYGALTHDVDYHSHLEKVNFYTSPVPYLAVGGGVYRGTVINYSPAPNQGPSPANVLSPNLNVEVKLFGDVDLQNSYVYTHFTDINTGAPVYDNHELISRWNYQFNKATSFNLIGQYISTLPNAPLTDARDLKTVFADALLTYMPHPGTALYVGYIGNFANLDRALCTREADGTCDASAPILPTTDAGMMNDGKNLYVKVSYLLRF